MTNLIRASVIATVISLGLVVYAEETKIEKAETVKNKAVDATKKVYRNAKDEVCEMVNGKMECMAKKVVNKVKSLSDKAETKTTETKNKID